MVRRRLRFYQKIEFFYLLATIIGWRTQIDTTTGVMCLPGTSSLYITHLIPSFFQQSEFYIFIKDPILYGIRSHIVKLFTFISTICIDFCKEDE